MKKAMHDWETTPVRREPRREQAHVTLTGRELRKPHTETAAPVRLQSKQWLPEVSSQLNKLLELPRNWDSYGADPIEAPIVESARGLLVTLAERFDLPRPFIAPTPNGGILLEWRTGSRELEVELVSRDAASYVFSDEHTGQECEGAIFRDPDGHGDPAFDDFVSRIC